MSTIHLWDNSWHVPQPDDNMKDSFGRKPCELKKQNNNDDKVFKEFSSF